MENFEVLQNIGKGSFGVVSKIKRKSDGKILVWKELNYGKMSEREKQQLVAEVNILRELRHPNIVRYYDRIIDKKSTKIYIIMEYCQGGDMGSLLRKCKKENDFIAEDVIWKIFTQIILALNECHKRKNKILHRDLKPANIFLDQQNNIKLGDFGLARIMGENSVFAQTHVGTPYYMSPEQINECKYNEKSDIWSTGCLLYEIAALKPPFEATNHLSLAIKIKSGKVDRLPQRYSEDLWKLVQSMLCTDPEQRPNITQLFTLPHVKLRIKEKTLRDQHAILKQKEEEFKAKEENIKILKNQVDSKQAQVEEWQKKVQLLKVKFQRVKELAGSSTQQSDNEKTDIQVENKQKKNYSNTGQQFFAKPQHNDCEQKNLSDQQFYKQQNKPQQNNYFHNYGTLKPVNNSSTTSFKTFNTLSQQELQNINSSNQLIQNQQSIKQLYEHINNGNFKNMNNFQQA